MTGLSRNNESPGICGSCGGKCCRSRPGIEEPERLLSAPEPVELLRHMLASGDWVLDRHYGLPPGENGEPQVPAAELELFYPRPATVVERRIPTIFATDAVADCVYLISAGCSLPFAGRPRMCRALVPDPSHECSSGWTRRNAARAWWPWQGLIAAALARLGHHQ